MAGFRPRAEGQIESREGMTAVDILMAKTLDSGEVCRTTGLSLSVFKNWLADGVIPDTLRFRDGHAFRYHAPILALVMIALDLQSYLGPKNGLVLPVIKKIANEIATAWKNPQPGRRMLRVEIDGRLVLLLNITPTIERARALVAEL
jgi:hypothetical protein